MEDHAHDLAQAKAAKLLKKRAPSVASGLSVGTDHNRRRGYAASIGTVSYVGHPYDDDDRRAKCENTYRMEPSVLFPVAHITRILRDVLSVELENQQYDPVACKEKTIELSDKIRAKVRDLSIPRYKIICLVHIGELNNQGLRISSRCLWNAKFDTFASHEFKNRSLFAVACVYGVYYE